MEKKGLKVAILSVSFLLMLRLTISPALAEIGKAFPNVSQGVLMNMVALPSLVAIPFGFLSGVLSNFFKKKNILLVGLGLFLIGGIGPMFMTSFTPILIMRAVLGAGTGLFLPFAAGLIADFYTGDERNHMLGLQSTAVAVGNVITSILAGVLATINWRAAFLIYAFGIVTLILTVIRIPEPERVEEDNSENTVNAGMMKVCLAIMVYAAIYFTFFGYLAFVVDEKGLGDASASGFATMLMTVASIFMGVIFGKLVLKLGKKVLPLSLLANTIGFLLLSVANVFVVIIAGAIMIGIGFGLLMPYGTMKVTDAAPLKATTFANGLFMTFVNIGTAVSPLLTVMIGRAFSNESGQFMYMLSAIVLGGATLVTLVTAFMGKSVKVQEEIN